MDQSKTSGSTSESVKSTQERFSLEQNDPKTEPDLDLVWREEVEDIFALADKAINASVPSLDKEEPERRFLAAGKPVRAPLSEVNEVEPKTMNGQDGFVPADPEELANVLQTRSYTIARTDIETVINLPFERQPVRILYEFEQPVYSAENVHGRLFTVANAGQRIPFQPGVGTTRIVQIIEPDEYPRQPEEAIRTLNLRIESGRAVWSTSES